MTLHFTKAEIEQDRGHNDSPREEALCEDWLILYAENARLEAAVKFAATVICEEFCAPPIHHKWCKQVRRP